MKGGVPFIGRRREQGFESRIWSVVLGAVLRRPAIAASVADAVLIALTIPALGMKTGNSGVNGLPQDLPVTKALNHSQAVFPGGGTPAQGVVQAQRVTAPGVKNAIHRLERTALATRQFSNPMSVDIRPDPKIGGVCIA